VGKQMKNIKRYTLLSLILVIITFSINQSFGQSDQGGANMCYHNGQYYSNSNTGSMVCPDPGSDEHQRMGHLTIDDPECLITSSEFSIQ
jgi:hypothetical protein